MTLMAPPRGERENGDSDARDAASPLQKSNGERDNSRSGEEPRECRRN